MAATAAPIVAIIILNWNGLADTLECLHSVFTLNYPNFEVIVVDNASTDGAAEVIPERYPQVVFLRNEVNLGFTGGNNLAIRYAMEQGAGYVWLLNNDTTVEPDCLSRIVALAESRPEIGLVSPTVHFYDDPETVQFCGNYVDWQQYDFVDLRRGSPPPDVDLTLWGTALLIKRAVVERIGVLNDQFFAYYEDQDYSLRALRAGFSTRVATDARIFHKDSRSTGSPRSPLAVFLRTRNRYLLWKGALEGRQWRRYRRRFLADVITTAAELGRQGKLEAATACLDAYWSGVVGAGGNRCDARPMPVAVRRIMEFFCDHFPYVWGGLLKGGVAAVAAELGKRLRRQ